MGFYFPSSNEETEDIMEKHNTLASMDSEPEELDDTNDLNDPDEELYPRVSLDEELDLIRDAQCSTDPLCKQEALARLVETHMGLVLHYARKVNCATMETSDLVQEGCLGLLTAIEKFDPSMGNRLGTYATYWIRQAMSRAVANHSRLIRMPVHIHESLRKIRALQTLIAQYLERQPTFEELAISLTLTKEELLGCLRNNDSVSHFRERLNSSQALTPEDVERILNAEVSMDSLDREISENSEARLGDFVADDQDTPDEVMNQREKIKQLRILVETLDERSRLIVESYYGLNNRDEQSLESIGRMIHLTRERVRQLLNDALHRLRTVCEQNGFADYRY
jgi:RNA polymerase primary sigma factor